MWRPFLIIVFACLPVLSFLLSCTVHTKLYSHIRACRVQFNLWQRTLTIYLIVNNKQSSDIFAPQLHCDWDMYVWVSKVGWWWCGLRTVECEGGCAVSSLPLCPRSESSLSGQSGSKFFKNRNAQSDKYEEEIKEQTLTDTRAFSSYYYYSAEESVWHFQCNVSAGI